MKQNLKAIISLLPIAKDVVRTANTAAPIRLSALFVQKILGINRDAYWPMHHTSLVSGAKNILIGIGTAPGLSPGCYIQGIGKIYIGDYTIIAPNVGIISANHDKYDYRLHEKKEVRIGSYCWIGMNSTIMPGVVLGDHVIVAANSVVTKSFPDGYCIVGGNPAGVIRTLEKDRCVRYENTHKYNGFIPAEEFDLFRARTLEI